MSDVLTSTIARVLAIIAFCAGVVIWFREDPNTSVQAAASDQQSQVFYPAEEDKRALADAHYDQVYQLQRRIDDLQEQINRQEYRHVREPLKLISESRPESQAQSQQPVINVVIRQAEPLPALQPRPQTIQQRRSLHTTCYDPSRGYFACIVR